MSALTCIYFLVDFFERIDNFLDAGKPISLAIKYFMLKIPLMVDMLQPVCILLAGVITLGLLNHNHETMALKAGGIGTLRIIRPILSSALFFTFLALFMAQWILPSTVAETTRIWDEEVHNKIPKGTVRQGRIYFKGSQGIYSFIRQNPSSNLFNDFTYAQIDQSYQPQLLLTAEKALWQNGKWTFFKGQLKKPAPNSKSRYKLTFFKQIDFDLPEEPKHFFAPTYSPQEQSISSLYKKTQKYNTLSAWVGLHSRLSYIFLGLPLIFMGLPVLIIVNQQWGKDLTIAVPLSCGLAFAAWGWWSMSQSLAKAAYLRPSLAAWSMYFIVIPLAYHLLKKQDS